MPEAKHCQEKLLSARSQSWGGVNQRASHSFPRQCTRLAWSSASLSTHLFEHNKITL